MKFTKSDIKDQELLTRLIKEEADRIFNSPSARKERSYDQVFESCSKGKVAELYMVESGEYEFADLRWHDLKKDGEYYEVKSYNVKDWGAPWIASDLKRYKEATWCKATQYMLFSCINGEYELLGIRKIK